MSILLGSTGAKAEREILTGSPSASGSSPRVAERLAWHNWANFGWPVWSDWKNKWKDWNNNWHNGWNNWGNNWKNWGNGWNNY